LQKQRGEWLVHVHAGRSVKELVHPKMKILSVITHPNLTLVTWTVLTMSLLTFLGWQILITWQPLKEWSSSQI